LNQAELDRAGKFISSARPAFEEVGYEVQTARLATVPFPHLIQPFEASAALKMAQALEEAVKSRGFEYLSLGPALPETPSSYPVIPDVLSVTQNVFLGGVISTADKGITLPAIRLCADIIHRAARLAEDGFANLRFAALANVPHGSPFFPAAYHNASPGKDSTPAFALATEAADLAVEACSTAKSLEDARGRLKEAVESHAQNLVSLARRLADQFKLPFGGIDFSLAPFPEENRSLGKAVENLGVPAAGMHGSLAALVFLAEAVDRASFPRAGFSGLLLPVMEDAVLARRTAEGHLTVKDLLLYSMVCGTGLDTVPLPGDVTPEQLSAILLDLAALAQRLNKPLTARLMPVPGKAAGDPTGFDFTYFANSRVMPLEAGPLHGALAGEETFTITGRNRL
jgi:hypothetical protein